VTIWKWKSLGQEKKSRPGVGRLERGGTLAENSRNGGVYLCRREGVKRGGLRNLELGGAVRDSLKTTQAETHLLIREAITSNARQFKNNPHLLAPSPFGWGACLNVIKKWALGPTVGR